MQAWTFRAEGFLSEIFVTLTGGAFLTGLAVALGAGPVALALLAALPFLAQVGQLGAPILEQRLGGRRGFVVGLLTLARLLWLAPVALLLAGMRGEWAVSVAVGAVFVQALFGMVAQNGWLAWVADLVPQAQQVTLFGHRAWAVALATLVASPIGAVLLDAGRETGEEGPVLAGLLGVGIVAGVAGALTLRRLPDAAPAARDRAAGVAVWRRLLQGREFRRVLVLFGAWYGAIGVSAPFWTLYMLNHLGWSFKLAILHTCIVLVIRLTCNGAWVRAIERVGSRKVLIATGFMLASNPVWWLVATRESSWPLWIEAVVSGVAWTGFNQAAFIQPMATLAPEDRSRGLGMFHVVTGAILFAASMLGGVFLNAADEAGWAFLAVFGASAVLRVVTAITTLRLTEPGVSVRGFFVDFVGSGVLRRPAGRLGAFLWSRRGSGEP